MNIHSEAKLIATNIIGWFYCEGRMKEDKNYPSHIVENLLTRQKRECIDNACDWLEVNSINYIGIDGITNWRELYKDFKQAMEE